MLLIETWLLDPFRTTNQREGSSLHMGNDPFSDLLVILRQGQLRQVLKQNAIGMAQYHPCNAVRMTGRRFAFSCPDPGCRCSRPVKTGWCVVRLVRCGYGPFMGH